MPTVTIYGLVDAAGTIRYVGASRVMQRRWRAHRRIRQWAVGFAVLAIVPPGEDWRAAERAAIAEWSQWGDLENQNRGGSGPARGTPGRPLSPEARERIGLARRGKPLSKEHRAALSRALKGKPKTPEHRARIAEGRRGVVLSPEHRAALAAGHARWLASRG